jgi:carbon monoxide dehydrogenase subunit G
MANIEVSIVINRPLAEVFAYLAGEENNVNWRSGMVDVNKTSEGPVGVGTTYRIVNHVMGRRIEGEAEVTQYELNRKYATRNKSGPRIETQRTFETVDGGTRVTFAVHADLAGLFQLAEPLIASIARRRFDNDVADLKDLLEHGAK